MIVPRVRDHVWAGHDVVLRRAEVIQADEHEAQVLSEVERLHFLVQYPFRPATLFGFHLDPNAARCINVRREDVDASGVAQRERRDIAAPRQLSGNEVLSCDAGESGTESRLLWHTEGEDAAC